MNRPTAAFLATAIAITVAAPASAESYFFRPRGGTIASPAPSLSLKEAALPSAKVGKAWTYDFAALAASANIPEGSISWSGTGLPSWLRVDPSTGIASGTPASEATTNIRVIASHGDLNAGSDYSLVVGPATFEASQVALGMEHACAVLDGGEVKCWGAGGQGQLGTGTSSNLLRPERSALASGAVRVYGGASFTCALLGGGEVKCWGTNGQG